MKKYELFSVEELRQMCQKSQSFRELASYIGYNPNGGSIPKTMKEMCQKYNFDTSHFTGQGHHKNLGKYKVPIETYFNNEQSITSYKLRNRLFNENYFEKRCCRCHNTLWLGQPIPLELHHKDGNKNNNALNNLEILCPNCHYFTETYKTKNWSIQKNESAE